MPNAPTAEQHGDVVGGNAAQDAGDRNHERAERQAAARPDAIEQRAARDRGADIDELPRAEDRAHLRVAEIELGGDARNQRRDRRRRRAETEIDHPHPGQHGPAMRMRRGLVPHGKRLIERERVCKRLHADRTSFDCASLRSG